MQLNENALEQHCIEWFLQTGWQYACGYEVAPDGVNPWRSHFHEAVLRPHLSEAVRRLNPELPPSAVEDVVATVCRAENGDLAQRNHRFYHYLREGVPVAFRLGEQQKNTHAQLLDFQHWRNNRFVVINQFVVSGTKGNRRPDVVCFINGLPIAVIELKNPIDEQAGIENAFSQLQTYKDEISDLFVFNQASVISDGLEARIGSLTANFERFMVWRTLKNERDRPVVDWQLETMVKGFFNPELLLDYLHYFIVFEQFNGKIIKKIAAYHQFHGVREAVQSSVLAAQQGGNKKAGVVWHTQGSGKSMSMLCYAAKLSAQAAMQNPTILVVTDRSDLDGQLFKTFCDGKALLRQTPEQANDREQLREMLASRAGGGVIFTTIQKFGLQEGETAHPLLNERHNLVVVSDEAHRTQYGMQAKFDVKNNRYQYGYAKHLRDALPNAAFIGFTGTPVSLEDKDTRAVFGEYVSIYDIQAAVEDKATVPIYYESRSVRLDLSDDIRQLAEEADEILEDDDKSAQYTRLEKLVGTDTRLRQLAEDLIAHFEQRIELSDGKAMVVAMSRDICVRLYQHLTALRPEWHSDDPEQGCLKIIMTGSAADPQHFQPHLYSKEMKKRLEKRFKDENDPLKIVIVRDMWLTGFDAPCCHTMYVDKPMKGHNLMQAIARVNRVFQGKNGGLVVDYIGIGEDLRKAVRDYTDSNGSGNPVHDSEEAFKMLCESMDIIRSMFATPVEGQPFDYRTFATESMRLLPNAVNHLVSLGKKRKDRFLDEVLKASKAYALCATLDKSAVYRQELAFFVAVKSVMMKHTDVSGKAQAQDKQAALRGILNNAVSSDGVEDIFASVGLEKPNLSLLSEEFLEDIQRMPQKNLAAELLQKLLKDEIKSKMQRNITAQKDFQTRLQETLVKYHNRTVSTAQVIEELIELAKSFQQAAARGEELGLNADELAFYDALADNESAVRELSEPILLQLAKELTDQLRRSVSIDWQHRSDVRAKIRLKIRRLLQRYKYPPDLSEQAINLVMTQAETLAESWGD
ncbi:type I restriction endonuclease subunit R [Testudinibacter sp. P27/CKL/0425]